MRPWLLLVLSFALGIMSCSAQTPVYFGTYTREDSKGIYRSTLDESTGQIPAPVLAVEVGNPSFLAFDPAQNFAYSVSEIAEHDGKKTGAVSSFRLEGNGSLTLLNQQPSGGVGPCHVSVDPSGKAVMIANYGGGSCSSFPVAPDGSLRPAASVHQHAGSSVNPRRQAGPHAHSIQTDLSGRRAYVPDLGLDKIFIYRLDPSTGSLTPNEPAFVSTPPGGGPRHLAFHPNGRFAYANLEMGNRVLAFSLDPQSGALSQLQDLSTLPPEFQGENTTAETLVHPSGQFVYVSNRGHDSIAAYSVDLQTGHLRFIECVPSGGQMPRNFGITPSGRILLAAHQKSNNVVSFFIHPQSGRLTPAGHEVRISSPVCVRFLRR